MIENNDIQIIRTLKPFGESWEIDSLIGKGSYGSVYKIARNEFNEQDLSALKWIKLPPDENYVEQLRRDGYKDQELEHYYDDLMQRLRQEIIILKKFSGTSHVVNYEDHKVIKREDGSGGYDIFIRMEYLQTLNAFLRSKGKITFQDIVRLGIDISEALILCQKFDIIHRDIKPENIFYKENVGFKLGDFGIARRIEKKSEMTQGRGTPSYMAPEVYHGSGAYDKADMYSLGLVMYRLLNDGRKPFDPPRPERRTQESDETAFTKRMHNIEPIPPPRNGSDRLWEIIRKACAFNPADRYSSMTQMREDLLAILRDQEMENWINPDGEVIEIGSLSSSPQPGQGKEVGEPKTDGLKNLPLPPPPPPPPSPPSPPPSPPSPPPSPPPSSPPPLWPKWLLRMAIFILIAIAVGFIALKILQPPTIESLKITNADYHTIYVSWKDAGSGPWSVSALPIGQTKQAITARSDETEYLIENLIPGVQYEIVIKNENTGLISSIQARTKDAPKASDEELKLMFYMLNSYRHSDLSTTKTLQDIVSDGPIAQLDGNEINLTNKPMISQEKGYLFSFSMHRRNAKPDSTIMVQLVLRFSVSGVYSLTLDFSESIIDYSFHLDSALNKVWEEKGSWPSDPFTIELYADGFLMMEQQMKLQLAQE